MIEKVKIERLAKNEISEQDDDVIQEHKVDIIVNGKHYISLMCLPQDLDELVVGFLFSEGIIGSYADVIEIDSSGTDDVRVVIDSRAADGSRSGKRVIVSGFAHGSVDSSFFGRKCSPVSSRQGAIKADEIVNMVASFNGRSDLFRKTGAVHSCLLVSDGIELFYEDIGRHNAIDKIIGRALIAGLSLCNGVLLTSGRVSSEVLLKAARMGIPILISTSAPTNMAVHIANDMNMTLIGFARGDRFNVYSGGHRVLR